MAKQFAWSYSKLNSFETCPKQYNEVTVLRNFIEKVVPDGPLAWGNAVHEAFKKTLQENVPLPIEMLEYQKWVDIIQKRNSGKLYVEQKFALDKNFQVVTWFSNHAWFRGIGDVVIIDGPVGLIWDWKTGNVKEDSNQLMLMAQCIFSTFPEVQKVRSEFIWLKENAKSTEDYTRNSMADEWIGVLQRVGSLETAHKENVFPPKPSGLCKRHCPVLSCPYYGKGNRG